MPKQYRPLEKRAAKRKARKEAEARGAKATTRRADRPSQSQMTHSSSGKAIKHRREAEARETKRSD